jgi:FkbM family methyltransferase
MTLVLRVIRRLQFPRKLGVCERLFARTLARHGICWMETSAGIPWKLDLTSQLHRWMVYGDYEGPEFIHWATRFLPPDGVVVDGGANIGQMLVFFARMVPGGRVLAFEPGSHAGAWIRECLARNPGMPVELVPCALGSAPGEAAPAAPGAAQQVRVVRLADVLEERGITRVDLWKLDVEGQEVPALQGAESWLKRKAIRALYVELVRDNTRRVIDYLRPLGYRLQTLDQRGNHEPAPDDAIARLPDWSNGLFLPE